MTYLDTHGRYLVEHGYPEPGTIADEAATLLAFLERQRATFAWKVGGLDASGLRTTIGSSPMTLGGMLKHLARFEDAMSSEWLAGQGQVAPWSDVDWVNQHDWDWRSAADDSPEKLYGLWRDAVTRSRALIADALGEGGPGRSARGLAGDRSAVPMIRHVLINMIEEYARHNGHADLIRESIDGLAGHDPPGGI